MSALIIVGVLAVVYAVSWIFAQLRQVDHITLEDLHCPDDAGEEDQP
ncbi:hypothetical protein OU415_02470 [Saccharopolyspora sp. WRP15-2]|uniref:Uncharacterized protein n=1 Tax=Saccharopolyspora oryzae TaxID=2997343 RepID=A0ABT4URG4_9PSEU|nr:hypothetical protein [Saccharopolyspora oryzae]MDA3624282.1 hypothetical protein [Saccharopolyspora oryzae]